MRAEDHSSMQTLAPASFSIVMAAINNAKQKGHSQVQPLHVAAALLDPHTRSIALHNACLQSLRDPTHPLKCDALDLCFKVALDRLPMNNNPEKSNDQSMSNALAAALKRAHANERRGTPEQSLQPLLAVKTGTAHLTISILDDPSVSRVFHEAGFSSTDVKNKLEDAMAQGVLAGPSTPPPPASDTTGLRRVQLTMSPYPAPHLDAAGMHFPNPFFPPPVPFSSGSSGSRGRLFGRGRGGHNVLELQPQPQPQPSSPYMSPGYAPPSLHLASAMSPRQLDARPLEQVGGMPARLVEVAHRKIVEMLLRSPGQRNPVLLSGMGCGSVVKEFSQRLMKGDIVPLRGAQFLDLALTRLSAGMLGQEVVERKMAKLRQEAELCIRRNGAILWIGDLEWLLERSQVPSVVLRDLHLLMTANTGNRLWLLASASPSAYERFQAVAHPSLEVLGLRPLQLMADDASGIILPPSIKNNKNAEVICLREVGPSLSPTANGGTGEDRLEVLDMCAECTRKFQQEYAVLVKEEQTLSLQQTERPTAGNFGNGSCWQKDRRPTLQLVKKEESLFIRGIEELRHKWHAKCSEHQPQPKNFFGGSPGTLRANSSSPVSESLSPPHENNPRMLLSPPAIPNRTSHPLRPSLNAKSEETLPLHARLAMRNVQNPLALGIGEADAMGRAMCRDQAAENALIPVKKGFGIMASGMDKKVNFGMGCAGAYTVGTDLALGRSALQVSSAAVHGIEERGQGQHPLHLNKLQLPCSKEKPAVRPSDVESLNRLPWSLDNSVPWQKEAVAAVAATVMKCRSGEGRKRGAPAARSDAWLMFLGPDRVGKREVAKSLAKILFNSEEKFVLLNGWDFGSSPGMLAADSKGVKYAGNCPLERLADAVNRIKFSGPVELRTSGMVVLLENIDRADYLVRRNLLAAMERGRLLDVIGREVSLANVVIIMTCDAGAGLLTPRSKERGPIEFDEEKLAKVVPREVRLLIEDGKSEEVLHRRGSSLSVVKCVTKADQKEDSSSLRSTESISIFGKTVYRQKRSASDNDEIGSHAPLAKARKTEASLGLSLDLNLSVHDNLQEERDASAVEALCETHDPDSLGDRIAKVIELARGRFHTDLFSRLDAAIVFKPFDLNRLTEWVLEKVDSSMELVMQARAVPVEVDIKLLEVMVSSAWQNFSNSDDIQGWLDNVLMRAVGGALDKALLRQDSVVKLIGAERRRPMTPEFAHSRSLSDDSKAELLPSLIQVCDQL